MAVSTVDVRTEIDTGQGWEFEVVLTRPGFGMSVHTVHLSWQDYDLWSRGAHPPVRVIEALLTYLLDHDGEAALRDKFDAARVRRFLPDVDKAMRAAIQPDEPD